ncbi:MAG TPA: cupin domain-containing protein [Gemmatimonadaceae bacterium]|nr:cupin domain-containing protein [Gemmatimonadaceae bacterium]
MLRVLSAATAAVALLGVPVLAAAQGQHSMTAKSAAALEWSPIQPTGFDPGMEITVIEGDPEAADKPYTLRLRLKDGYRFPAHYHPKAENVTVLSGTFLLAMGSTPSDQLKTYAPGDFLHIPPSQPHYGGARGVTVIQLHGDGPFEIILAKPAKTRP